MLDIAEYVKVFADCGLIRFPASYCGPLSLPRADTDFLVNVGLPADAAPFLGFHPPSGDTFPTLAEYWPDPRAWHNDPGMGSRYRVIGSNGSGDPVAIDMEARGQVVYLNHDHHFSRVLMNSSVVQLAAALLQFAKLIDETIKTNGPDAYLDGRVPPLLLDRFVAFLGEADAPAIAPETMWGGEIRLER